MTEPFRLTASQAQAKFKDGSLTVEEYAKSLLSRVEARDSAVHAWAYLSPELVLQRARELDQIPPEKRGPLHGIAIGVKDVILTKDMPTQHNSPIYEDDAPKIDAASITVLRANGALIFGMFVYCADGYDTNDEQARRQRLNSQQLLSDPHTKAPRQRTRTILRAHLAARRQVQQQRLATFKSPWVLEHRPWGVQ